MRHDEMDPRVKTRPWRTLAACLAIGLAASVLASGMGMEALAARWRTVALVAAALAAWAYFGAWTWRRLARLRETEHGRRVHRMGVLGFGLGCGALSAATMAAQNAGGLGGVLSAAFAHELVIQALIYFPLALWGGYLWGTLMSATFPLPPRGRRASPGQHPAGPGVV